MNQYQQAIINRYNVKSFYIKDQIDFLIKSEQDYNEFMKYHNTGLYVSIFTILCKMRESRLEEFTINRDTFIQLYNQNATETLEWLFQHNFDKRDIKNIRDNNMTPEQIWDANQLDRNLTFKSSSFRINLNKLTA